MATECSDLVNGLDCKLQNNQVISNQACRFRNFFLGPIPELFSVGFLAHFLEMPKIMSTQLTLRYFTAFQEMSEFLSAQTQTWHSWHGAQKKVPESAGLVRGSGSSFGPDLIFKSGPKHQI